MAQDQCTLVGVTTCHSNTQTSAPSLGSLDYHHNIIFDSTIISSHNNGPEMVTVYIMVTCSGDSHGSLVMVMLLRSF